MSYIRRLASAIRSEVAPHLVPPGSDDLFLIYAALACAKDGAVTAKDIHHAWTAWMEIRGETHPSMVPFSDLEDAVKREDDPFVRAIHKAFAEMR